MTSDSDSEEFPDISELSDPTTRADNMLRAAVGEPFGRQMKALERQFGPEEGLGLIRINLLFDPTTDAGEATLVITEMFPEIGTEAPVPVEASIVVGTKGLHKEGIASYEPTFGQFEQANALGVRLAIAHELGHLALRHAIVGGTLEVPEEGFSKAQDWEAGAYAIYLVKTTGKYLARRRRMLIPYWKSIQEWVDAHWPRYAAHPVRLAFEGFLQRRSVPWPFMTDQQINDFRMGQ